MGEAYTPGLKVTGMTIVKKERRLPLLGDVLPSKGDKVKAEDVVAKTELPGPITPVNVANVLSCLPGDIPGLLRKQAGDKVSKGETIASLKTFFGLFTSLCKAPTSGVIEDISKTTGQVYIRGDSIPVEVKAYIDGEIIDVLEKEGVIIQAEGAFIQGIFGIGPETVGEIEVIVENPEDVITEDMLHESHEGKVLVGGSLITYEALQKAVELKVNAVIVGGFNDKDLREFLGYDLGVAITGKEDKGITLVITEGFGKINIARKTFDLFCENRGKKASVNGATQIRAGVIRPEIIIPKQYEEKEDIKEVQMEGLVAGTPVRIIREPYFGLLGKIKEMPVKLKMMESETMVRTVVVALDEKGEDVLVPRANVEIIET